MTEIKTLSFNDAVEDYMAFIEVARRARKRFYRYTDDCSVLITRIEKHFGVQRDSHDQVVFRYRGYELVLEGRNVWEYSLCLNY